MFKIRKGFPPFFNEVPIKNVYGNQENQIILDTGDIILLNNKFDGGKV